MTQANDLPPALNPIGEDISNLKPLTGALLNAIEKNAQGIAALIEISRQHIEIEQQNSQIGRGNSEAISGLLEVMGGMRDVTASLHASQKEMHESIRSIQAAIERMDRLFDYLIQRDQIQRDHGNQP